MKDWEVCLAISALAALCLVMGFAFGGIDRDSHWEKEAIKNNAAEWRIDPKTGKKKFVWITAEAKP
jgi:hypothetical protein